PRRRNLPKGTGNIKSEISRNFQGAGRISKGQSRLKKANGPIHRQGKGRSYQRRPGKGQRSDQQPSRGHGRSRKDGRAAKIRRSCQNETTIGSTPDQGNGARTWSFRSQ